VEANTNGFGDLGTAVNEAVTLGVKVVSDSWGTGEFNGETGWDGVVQRHRPGRLDGRPGRRLHRPDHHLGSSSQVVFGFGNEYANYPAIQPGDQAGVDVQGATFAGPLT